MSTLKYTWLKKSRRFGVSFSSAVSKVLSWQREGTIVWTGTTRGKKLTTRRPRIEFTSLTSTWLWKAWLLRPANVIKSKGAAKRKKMNLKMRWKVNWRTWQRRTQISPSRNSKRAWSWWTRQSDIARLKRKTICSTMMRLKLSIIPRKVPEQRHPPSLSNQLLWRKLLRRPRSQSLCLKFGRLQKRILALQKKSLPIFRLVSRSSGSRHIPGLRSLKKRRKMTLLLKLRIKTLCG